MPKNKNKSKELQVPLSALIAEARAHGATEEKMHRQGKKLRKQLRKVTQRLKDELRKKQALIHQQACRISERDHMLEQCYLNIVCFARQIDSLLARFKTAGAYEKRLLERIQNLESDANVDNETIKSLLAEIEIIEGKHKRATKHVETYKFSAMVRRKPKSKKKKKKKKKKRDWFLV